MKTMQFSVEQEQVGGRIDLITSELSGLTRSQVQNLIVSGQLSVNGERIKPNYKARSGDSITICIAEQAQTLVPENIPIDVLFQDDFLIVVNKPPEMVVYPAAGHSSGTLMNAIAFHANRLASIGGPLRPGVVHRLDKDTSGVMVIALDDRAYYDLVEQFRERTMNRRYQALIFGNLKEDSGEISLRIGRSESDRKKMSTHSRRGKEAVTTWKVIERFRGATLIEAKLGTGRTHQIRVHFASIGHPVLGDRTYGSKTSIEIGRRKIIFHRQMLHAELLGFTHPITKEPLEFRTAVPDDMQEKISELRNGNNIS
ncbi:MAG: RluA family pseudouridine synthase [Nitrospirae bacterium]|nr:RluA family pseudouridine synthase [Nitrospirota bacterium]